VTHYWRHSAWLDEGALLHGVDRLAGIPAVLLHGRLDVSSPLDVPWALAQAWDGGELVVLDDAGHKRDSAMTAALIAAAHRFAGSR